MNERRIVWIDWAKAILIYLMVVGHCFPVAWENQLIYAFHMPAFFIISGYLYRQRHWMKTIKSFCIPILFFSVINFVIYAMPKLLKGEFSTNHLVERVLVPFWGGGRLPVEDYIILFPGVWFIIVLMLGRLIIGDIKYFGFMRRYWQYVFLLIVAFLVVEPYIIPNNQLHDYKWFLVVPSLPFILFGYGFKERIRFEKVKPWMFLLGLLVFLSISLLNGRTGILGYSWGVSYFVFFMNAILGSLLLYYGCSKLKQSSVIEVLSKGTLLIMAFNFVLKVWGTVLFDKLGLVLITSDRYVYPWILGLLIMLICYYPIKWLLKYCPFLLGK